MATQLVGSAAKQEQQWLTRAQEGGEIALSQGTEGPKLYNAKRNFGGMVIGWIKDQIGDADRKQRRDDAKTEFQAFLNLRFGAELGAALFARHVDPGAALRTESVAVAIAQGQRGMLHDVDGAVEVGAPRGVDIGRHEVMTGGIVIGGSEGILVPSLDGTVSEAHGVGTLGLVVRDGDGQPLMLTCRHVLEDTIAKEGENLHQPPPGRPGSRQVGGGYVLPRNQRRTESDFLGIQPTTGTKYRCGALPKHPVAAPEGAVRVGPGPGGAGLPPKPGDTVYKYGAITGWREGKVVEHDKFKGFGIAWDADPTTRFGEDGDSGSIILNAKGHAVGMLVGAKESGGPDGSSLVIEALDMGHIVEQLKIQIAVDDAPQVQR